MAPTDVWEERRKAIYDLLKIWESFQAQDFDGKESLDSLVKGLTAFAIESISGTDPCHFSAFYEGFSSNTLGVDLIEDTAYPPEYALHTTIAQILYDLETIYWAATQRSRGPDNVKEALKTADGLARRALQPAIDGDLVPDRTTVVTYLQKSANIRVTPYAEVALIGVPSTAIYVPQDYLAIPHEIGHYVFHHGTIKEPGQPDKYILDVLKADFESDLKDSPCAEWIDEIFADVYGCLCADLFIALDWQDIQLEYCQKDFIDGDGEHPVPALRPCIYHQVLNRDNTPWPGYGDLLEDIWKYRRSRLADDGQLKKLDDYLDPQDPNEMPRGLQTAVGHVLKYLKPRFRRNSTHRWCKHLPSNCSLAELTVGTEVEKIAALTKLQGLYTQFDGDIQNLILDCDPSRKPERNDDWRAWVQKRFYSGGPLPDSIPADKWLQILTATGWVTLGNGRWKR